MYSPGAVARIRQLVYQSNKKLATLPVSRLELRCWFCIAALHDWLKKLASVFIQSEPIATRSRTFSRPLRHLPLITSRFDWFTGFSASFVIG